MSIATTIDLTFPELMNIINETSFDDCILLWLVFYFGCKNELKNKHSFHSISIRSYNSAFQLTQT